MGPHKKTKLFKRPETLPPTRSRLGRLAIGTVATLPWAGPSSCERLVFDKSFQALAAAWVPEFAQSFRFDLTNAFTRDVKVLPDLF